MQALRYENFEMPPKGKLPAAVIADFEQWIKHGAVDPREGSGVAGDRRSGRRSILPPAGSSGRSSRRSRMCRQPVSRAGVAAAADR